LSGLNHDDLSMQTDGPSEEELQNFPETDADETTSILIKPVFSYHLSYVTLFKCPLGRSHNTGLTIHKLMSLNMILYQSAYLSKFSVNFLM
jgi:hypothetical protein